MWRTDDKGGGRQAWHSPRYHGHDRTTIPHQHIIYGVSTRTPGVRTRAHSGRYNAYTGATGSTFTVRARAAFAFLPVLHAAVSADVAAALPHFGIQHTHARYRCLPARHTLPAAHLRWEGGREGGGLHLPLCAPVASSTPLASRCLSPLHSCTLHPAPRHTRMRGRLCHPL